MFGELWEPGNNKHIYLVSIICIVLCSADGDDGRCRLTGKDIAFSSGS